MNNVTSPVAVVTGASSGLGIADIVTIIGKDELAARMKNIKEKLG